MIDKKWNVENIKKLSKFEWAKNVAIIWMVIVEESNDKVIVNDTEIKIGNKDFNIEEKFSVMTKEEYIGRQADYYNQECATGLNEIEEWIDSKEYLALHKRGIELGLVKLIPGEQELLEKLKYELN